ncbi:MAG: M23 family metallopeptidase [Cytophagales bacterium]|nr:M23 family metallopeptidase [Rhizobacter sp.]
MGFGVTAFGIAPLAPDAADLPRRLVTEIVTPENITSQLETLASHSVELYRSDLTRSADTADSLLARLNVSDVAAAAFLRSDKTARKLLEGRAGKMVQVRAAESGALEELVARYPAENSDQYGTHFSRLRVTRVDGVLQAQVEVAALESQVRLGSGTIRSSLFAATDESRIPDPVAIQMAEMFSTDIDFHRELRRGDTFSVLFEALTADGEPITWSQAAGRVLAAEFVNNGRSYAAVWFQEANSKGGYYGFNGESKRRSFLASPMEFSRVTSGFAMRMHPIHQTWRAHLGVDYGAPTGTPVRSVGDGVVDFAGRQNGYGNVVQIRHSNDRTTLYAHLSRIDVRQGQRVEQGVRVGAVGATGWATGPHLHFEVRVKGQHQNPTIIAKTSEAVVLSAAAQAQFAVVAKQFRQQLELAAANPQLYAAASAE